MLKILALGNSFSQDATAHLEKMTEGAYVRNLYIGGCSLERHANNLTAHETNYQYQKDGVKIAPGPDWVCANDIFASKAWDVVTVQQVSQLSGLYETYEPHLGTVLGYIRKLCPTAKIVWHQTWAYAANSTHEGFANYGRDQKRMLEMIEETSHRVARENGLGRIEVGKAIQTLRAELEPDGTDLCRDGFHLSCDYGRYAAAYVWARYFGLPVKEEYLPDGADPERIRRIRELLSK